ncbi:MAG: type II toxin-antitoxin system VapC family toxin [Azonexus sp.]|nr:type II toxin-antitoxin system VapC family toxin [Azonexus sp.]
MLLLDTNIVYRWLMGVTMPPPLIERVRGEGALVSILSPWEMLIKHQIGKLDLPTLDVAGDIAAQGFPLLPIKPEHLLILGDLPFLHRDPFDRLLLAQAKAEKMIVVTSDRIFSEYLPDAWVV